jgi:hypothetical protein
VRRLAVVVLLAFAPACAAEVRAVAEIGPTLRAPPPPPPPPPALAPPPPDEERPDPAARALFAARSGAPRAFAELDAPPGVALLGLRATARGEGMRPASKVLVAVLGEGDQAAAPFTIEPRACASFVAQGALGVIEVDLFVTAAGDPRDVLAEDASTGPVAIVGGRRGRGLSAPVCAGDAARSVEVRAQARRGAGAVLVQRLAP